MKYIPVPPLPPKYSTECYICLAPLPFVDVRPQVCTKCWRAMKGLPGGMG